MDAKRFDTIDVARALGLVLVYYGHFVEQIMYLKNPDAAVHYKWIYSFHMILFFILSGWVRGVRPETKPLPHFIKSTAAGRLVPYLFFSLFLALVSLVLPGWYPVVELSSAKGYLLATASTAMGFPIFNIPLWFVACLVGVESLHRLLQGYLDSSGRIWLVALGCYAGGYVLNQEYFFFGMKLNFWLLHEVPVVYAFYLTGVALGRSRLLESMTKGWACALFLAGLVAVQLTFDLNQGPFRYLQAVIILLSGHGHFLWFPFTALAGSAMVLALGRLLSASGLLAHMGRNALILLGMNGFFYHFINQPLAGWFNAHLPAQGWSVFLFGAVVTAGSLLLCLPVIRGMNFAFPQLVGKPRAAGAFLGPLLRS